MENTFNPSGELTFDTVQSNLKVLKNMFSSEDVSTLELNLSDVIKCDSAGLALLIEARRLSHQYNKNLVIKGASETINSLAEFCGVEFVLK